MFEYEARSANIQDATNLNPGNRFSLYPDVHLYHVAFAEREGARKC